MRKRGLARVPQDRSARTDQKRQVGRRRREACDDIGRPWVSGRIEKAVGLPVATKEIREADHVARRRGADQKRASFAELEQCDTAEHERAHDALAELCLVDDERPQLLGREEQRLDVALRVTIDQRRGVVSERAELGEELSWSLIDDRRDAPETVARSDGDVPREDDVHAQPAFASFEEGLAVGEPPHAPEAADPRDLGLGEGWECLVESAVQQRACGGLHCVSLGSRHARHRGRAVPGPRRASSRPGPVLAF
jgi:hypothetical protein